MIQNIVLALFFLIGLVFLDGCSTFKDHYSIGVGACKEMCLKGKPCKLAQPSDDYGFECE